MLASAVRSATQSAGVRLTRFDRMAMAALHKHSRPKWAVATARTMSELAEPPFVSLVMTIIVLLTARETRWRAACMPYLAVTTGTAVRHLLSQAIARPRPPADWWLTEPEGFSMPSKHTTLAVLATGACVRHAGARGMTRHFVPLVAGAGVGASRVYLGVHWPSDILAAWLFAEGWLRFADPRDQHRPSDQAWARPPTAPDQEQIVHGTA